MESKERLRAEENVCMMFNRFLSLCNAEQEEHKTLILNMKQAFLEIAPVDAVEVVHGRFKFACVHNGKKHYKCTNCHHAFPFANVNYCPQCGAKMDGDGNG